MARSTRYRRVWPAPLTTVVLALVFGSSAALLTGCGGSGGSSAAPTISQARELLDRQAAAVLHHSASAYLADVDTGSASAKYRAAQTAMIDNIAEVPLASWSYPAAVPVTDPAAAAAADARYGRKTLLLRVTLSYALQGVDPLPTTHDQWLTFVQRGGHVLLAGDDDMVNDGGTSWQGIWDFGPVSVARGSDSLVLGHPGDAARLAGIAAAVDAAIPAVTEVWGTSWSRRVAVLVPATAAELGVLVGSGSALTDVSAVAVTDGTDPLSGAPVGQRLVIDPSALNDLSAVGTRIVLRHEITHLATAAATSDTTPRWVVEGFADYVGNLGSGQPVSTAAAELAAQVRHGNLPGALPGDDAFAPGSAGAASAYEQAWLACRLIATRAGQSGLVAFYRSVGTADAPPAQAVAAALATVLHESVATFTSQWRTYLAEELR